MKKGIFTLIAVISFITAFGQNDIHSTLKPLFNKDGILEAEKLVDQYLKKDPKNVDALMYKGNVVYYKNKLAGPTGGDGILSLNSNMDESIYDNSVGSISDMAEIVPGKVATEAISYWLKAVSINPKREDIHLGISHMYSISLQTQKLIDYLPTVVKHTQLSPYDMANYARNLIERDAWEDGIKVYMAITGLFPDNGGIMSDLASEYYLKGKIDLAKQAIDKALLRKDKDEMTYGNAFFIYSIVGEYDLALNAITKQCALTKNDDYLLYQGIVELNNNKPKWREQLKLYMESLKATNDGISLAKMLLEKDFAANGEQRLKLTEANMNDGYMMPINEYFSNNSNDFNADYYYAEALTYHNMYNKAVKVFAAMDATKASKEEQENYYLHYAWAKYKSCDAKGALALWEPLLLSEGMFYKSAAAYFMGRYYFDAGDKKKAKEYFSIAADKPKSKYANFCSFYMKRL